ncbi:MAG TPA: hypothetical protein VEC99_13745 [Clostridia bacterium]|nr:hypothetical protein [Clostridia bacterium]
MSHERIRWNHFRRPVGILAALLLVYGCFGVVSGLALAEGGLAFGWHARLIGLLFLLAGGWLFSYSYWVVLGNWKMKVTSNVLAALLFAGMGVYVYVNLRV